MVTTIQIDEDIKKRLDKLKVHYRETYNDLIRRLTENCSPQNMDRESLIATVEVLSDPELIRGIKEALERIESGDYGTPIEEVKKELGLN
ncbi:MAG: antitoxin VapB family protein [Nanoarchaeota archaeon]|nr:antitoxin VapB family protein [Nanoarchaeota archaeon]